MADLLSIARSGLNSSKSSLETTGHNIANANTEGYSRQRVRQVTNTPTVKNGLIQGTGSLVDSIKRIEDKNLNKRVQDNLSEHSNHSEAYKALSQVEVIFNEADQDGLNKIVNKFFNSFRQLANQPENETIRSVVRDNARLVVKDIKRIRGSLDAVAKGIDARIGRQVEDINNHLRALGKINYKIASLEAMGQQTGDLRDQRDNHLRGLSEFFKIHTYTDQRGAFNVSAVGVGTLVSAANYQELMASPRSKSESTNNMAGSVEVYFKSRQNHPISNKFRQGSLPALFKTRNVNIKKMQDKIDKIAFALSTSVNEIHRKGFKSGPLEIGPDGQPKGGKKITGIDFFKPPAGEHLSARFFSLSDDVEQDLNNISTAFQPNAPGDNRVALAISKLQSEKVMANGTATIEEEFLKSVGEIGIQVGKSKLDAEQSEGLLAQAKSLRERLVGVSIDEEAANLVRFQHAYEASAKVLASAEEMFDTVLNLKR